MPSTIVKLSSSDARAWASNQPVWLEENGSVARPVTRLEQAAISNALRKYGHVNQSFKLQLPLLPVGRSQLQRPLGPREKPQIAECAFHVRFVGRLRVVTVYQGSLRYATGREILKARLLADHGECILHGRNGKCLTVLRDPFVNQRAPRVPGPRVQWSRNPADPDPRVHQKARMPATKTVSGQPTFSPEKCPNDCRGRRGSQEWALAVGAIPPNENEHHPVCTFAQAWARTLAPSGSEFVIYDVERAVIAREASATEVEEALANEKSVGAAQVTITNRVFAVLKRSDAEQALREARGEDVEEVTGAPDLLLPEAPDVESTEPPSLEERENWLDLSRQTQRREAEHAQVTVETYLQRARPEARTP